MILPWGPTRLSRVIIANAQLSDTRELDKNQIFRFFCLPLTNLREEPQVNLLPRNKEQGSTNVDAKELVLILQKEVSSTVAEEIAFIFDRE